MVKELTNCEGDKMNIEEQEMFIEFKENMKSQLLMKDQQIQQLQDEIKEFKQYLFDEELCVDFVCWKRDKLRNQLRGKL